MNYELGTITVKAEIREEADGKIENLSDVKAKYGCLGQKQKEHTYAVFLTNANDEIGDKLIGLGRRDSSPIDVQDVARTAALVNAGAVILVHNHPSGKVEPSQGDIETTQDIYDTLDQLGVELLDHVVISRDQSHSMRMNHDGPF